MIQHDFRERLAYSELASCEPFWDAIYRRAFPNLVSHMPCPGDFQSQRMGIDRIILLSNGRTLAIDEKKREEEYPDILLEYISRDKDNVPGWIEKDLAIDFLAYAFMPSRRVYLFPWETLRRAWRTNKLMWLDKYKIPPARNNGYNTLSVAVPIGLLLQSVSSASIVKLD